MSAGPAERPLAAATRADAARIVAEDHQAQQGAQRAKAVAMIAALWATMDGEDMIASWVEDVGPKVFVLLAVVQELMASAAGRYVWDSLLAQGVDLEDVPLLDQQGFSGLASDGRDLETLLAGAVIRARHEVRTGATPDEGLLRGGKWLDTVAKTQISDAGRAADAVAIIAADPITTEKEAAQDARDEAAGRIPEQREPQREPPRRGRRDQPVTVGWVRMLEPPSCGRCAILAGRFYKWSDGFQRHPNCDCKHIPAIENVSGDLTTDPALYFDSLTDEEQNLYFGVANAEAIRNGADMNQVVNASTRKGGMFTADDGRRYTREGTTRSGLYGGRRGRKGVLRPTPWQLMKDAEGDREVARELLTRFGYIL